MLALALILPTLTCGAAAGETEAEMNARDAVQDMTWGVNLTDLYIADLACPAGSPLGYVTEVPYEIGIWTWDDAFHFYSYNELQLANRCNVLIRIPEYDPRWTTPVEWIGLFNIGIKTMLPHQEISVTLSGTKLRAANDWEGPGISLEFLNGTYTGFSGDEEGNAWFHVPYDKSRLPAIDDVDGMWLETTIEVTPSRFASDEDKADYFYQLNRNKMDREELTDLFLGEGANVVRLPVTWTAFVDDENNYKIDEAWLEAVAAEVDYILDSGAYCILNMHNDYLQRSYVAGQWRENWMDNGYWENALVRFQAIWRQIADYFQDYPRTLFFETANEPVAIGTAYDTQLQRIPALNQAFVDVVRGSGGNNPTRILCLATPNFNTYGQLNRPEFTLPKNLDENMLVELHCYDAMEVHAFNTQTSAGFDYVEATAKLFAAVETFQEKYPDVPILLGEIGATHRESDEALAPRVEHLYREAKESGVPCLWWEDYFVVDANTHYWLYDKAAGDWGRPLMLRAIQDAVDLLCVRVRVGEEEFYFSSSRDQPCRVAAAAYSADGALLDMAVADRAKAQHLVDLNLDAGRLPAGSTVRAFLLDSGTWTPIAPAEERTVSG